jgi:hypothetical protein
MNRSLLPRRALVRFLPPGLIRGVEDPCEISPPVVRVLDRSPVFLPPGLFTGSANM